MMPVLDSEKKLEFLRKRIHFDISLNETRILVGCLNAVAYQGENDDQAYLDPDALELKSRLETLYKKLFEEQGSNCGSH
jgi:hypothetical protein